jgi:hypothetical protein
MESLVYRVRIRMEFIIEIKILPISLVETRLPGEKLDTPQA